MKGRTEDSIIDLVPHFILFLSKISKIRHICVGLRTSRLLVYLLGRQLPVPHVTISMTSLSDVSISNSNSFAKQPNGEQTKLWALNKVIFRQKIRFFAKITIFTIIIWIKNEKIQSVPRIMIDLAVLKIHDFLLRKFDDFRRKFLLELNFCVVNSTGCFLPPKNQESSSLLKFQHFFMFIPVLPSKIEHFGVDH